MNDKDTDYQQSILLYYIFNLESFDCCRLRRTQFLNVK